MDTLTTFVLVTCIRHIVLIDVTRLETGDVEPFVPCNDGTFIVNEDLTHSFYCAKSMAQAGCDLKFVSTNNVGFIPSDRQSPKTFGIQSSSGTLCQVNSKPVVANLHIQDYPSNIFKKVWTDDIGIKKVNETLQFEFINENMIKLEVDKHWPGVLLKISFHCIHNNEEVINVDTERYCVLVKYEGKVDFPLSQVTFDPDFTTAIPSVPSTSTDLLPRVGAMREEDNNEILIFAICAGLGTMFILIAIFSTVGIIHMRLKRRRLRDAENGRGQEDTVETKPKRVLKKTKKSKINNKRNGGSPLQVDEHVQEGGDEQDTEPVNIGEPQVEELEGLDQEMQIFAKATRSKSRMNKNRRKELENISSSRITSVYDNEVEDELTNDVHSSPVPDPDYFITPQIETPVHAAYPRVFPLTPVHHAKPTPTSSIRGSRNGSNIDTPVRFQPDTLFTYQNGGTGRKVTYVEGHQPDDRIDDLEATSESIEAMFSFSNEALEESSDIDNTYGDEIVNTSPGYDDAVARAFPEDDDDYTTESFQTFRPKNKKRNPLAGYPFEEEPKPNMFLF